VPSKTRLVTIGLLSAALVVVLGAATLLWLWRDRPALTKLPWQLADTAPHPDATVSVTWLGISSLLFDDGETQILIDGAFTRLTPLDIALLRRVRSDVATVNYALDEYRIDRLAAIVPVHSHFDHAIDVGLLANRSTALLLGSESSANIARGAGVPVDQFQILASGEQRVLGDFTITLVESRHVPGLSGWPGGVIEEPLAQPARFWAWRGGAAYAVLLSHPAGTTLIQGGAGFEKDALADYSADAVLLSVAGLAAQGQSYTRRYWQETVGKTGAELVYAIHFDDVTRPLGEVMLPPKFIDDVVTSAGWLNEMAGETGVDVLRPPFGVPVPLY